MSIEAFQPTVALTQDQIAFFHENGYLSLPPITGPAELAWLRTTFDRLFAQRAGRAEGAQFDLGGTDEEGREALLPQILAPDNYAPELKQGQFRANAWAIARQLLGEGVLGNGDHAIFKPAGNGAPTPWHQDEAYWDPRLDHCALSVWMPLQPATVDNGCLWFVPGSHRGEVLPHQSIGGDTRVHGLELVHPQVSGAVACPLEPGGVTIHHNRTLHFAAANTSGIPRRALVLGFRLEPTPRQDERRFVWNEIKNAARRQRQLAAQARQSPDPA